MKAQQMINEAAIEAAVVRKLADALPVAVHEAVHAFLEGIAPQAANEERTVKNGVREPKQGGKCHAVWSELDKLTKQGGEVPTLQQMFDLAASKGWNANNTRIEYYQWRRFHGHGAVIVEHRHAERRQQTKAIRRKDVGTASVAWLHNKRAEQFDRK